MPQDAFVLKIQRESGHPKCARKVSGLVYPLPNDTLGLFKKKSIAKSDLDKHFVLYFMKISSDCLVPLTDVSSMFARFSFSSSISSLVCFPASSESLLVLLSGSCFWLGRRKACCHVILSSGIQV